MAEAPSSSKLQGLSRGKAILIGVLGLVLVVIVYVQYGPSGEGLSSEPVGYRPPGPAVAARPTSTAATPAPAPAAAVANVVAAKTPGGMDVVVTPIIDPTHWKSPPLDAVLAYDPFALPAAFPQPAKMSKDGKTIGAEGIIEAAAADDAKRLAEALEKLHMQLEELKQRGVHVIVRESDQYAAMIGDRMLHVGDEINGFTVTAIDPNGVHVERKESP